MGIAVYIFFALLIIGFIWLICRKIQETFLFKKGRNPYHRICRKCGAHQNMYQSNIEGLESHYWWEDVYPIGNNENCLCHKFTDYHS